MITIIKVTNQPTNQPTNQLNNELNNSMEQNPSWEANSYSASREITQILWNLKV
jgi:hypothetical protein